jgi:hypothetical protein
MIQQTTFLLRSIWKTSVCRDEVLATFEKWILDGASRSSIKGRLRALIESELHKESELSRCAIDLGQINWEQLTEFLCACFYRKRLRSSLPDVPSDDMWMQLTDQQNWGPLSLHPQQDKPIQETVPVPLFPLEQKLLTVGGTRMVYRYEPDLKRLLKNAVVFDECAELIPGTPHTCHSNVAHYWNENKEILAIATGYALSEDGLWRQHSWLLRKNVMAKQCPLLETTVKREKYFGIILTDTEAESFSKANE